MAKSLADQLLGAGLVDKKKVKQAKQEKRIQTKQVLKGHLEADTSSQERLAQQRAEKAERDRQLNEQRVAEERAKAIRAQVKQMLQQSKQVVAGDVRFSFTDARTRKIKQMYVTAAIQEQLARGQLVICADNDSYVVVPRNVADKVAERAPDVVIFVAEPSAQQLDEDDPYKDFPIPDDLMW
ncbi:DUF2058 domain-containing protein [Salinispirillum sp. LH 10-3-1]|uniref:DUF2058 domain-containing protein n=1 Tax=Salinispirillum sp. LH 10-3-1 TaxID=2952525 RepID=A0AB38YHH8_9GAMM